MLSNSSDWWFNQVLIQDLKDKVKISVKDSGIGIQKKNNHNVDKFNQVIDDNSKQKW